MCLAISAGGTVLLENPASSIMIETEYFLHFVRNLKKVGLPAPWVETEHALFVQVVEMSDVSSLAPS